MRLKSFFLASLILCSCLTVKAQTVAQPSVETVPPEEKTQIETDRGLSRQKSENLTRPAKLQSLRQFVKKSLAGKFDDGTLTETLANGKPAITFSFAGGEETTDAILIDDGDKLQLHTDTYPTRWKFAPGDPGESAEPESKQVSETASTVSAAPKICAGLISPGNPYPCCSLTKDSPAIYGNCTFAAWYHANSFWGYSLPGWGPYNSRGGHAKYWFDNARDAGLPTSPTPALYSIAVSSTRSGYGHVAWVMEISNNMLTVLEQNCGSAASGVTVSYLSTNTFDKGYILSPVSAPSPAIFGHSPNLHIWASPYTQAVRFNVQNVNPGMRAVVVFPNGGRATLKDSQLRLEGYGSQTLTAYMALNARGWWNIQIFNENGKYSGMYWFYVNQMNSVAGRTGE